MPTILRELTGIEAASTRYMGLHVATKILIPLFLSISILFTKDPLAAISLIVISALTCKLAGIPLSAMKKYVVVIGSMTSFIALSFVLFAHLPGRVFYEATLLRIEAEKGVFEWKILVTDTALSYAATFIARIFAMVLTAILLLGTVTDRDFVWGLRSVGLPFGACVAASLFFRGIQLFVSDFMTIREAMSARGVDFERTSLARRFLLYANALIPLLSLMITRSYEMSLALEARGIAPSTRAKAVYHRFAFRRRDLGITLTYLAVMMAFILWWLLW